MPRNIAYIGFGSLGKQLSVLLRQTMKDELKEVFFDDIAVKENLRNAHPFDAYTNEQFAGHDFFITIGYKQFARKREITAQLKKLDRNLPAYIHPSVIINPNAVIGQACIVYPGCNIDQHCVLQDGVFLNNSVTVSHNSVIGENSFLAPGVVVCGNVRIGAECFIGAGSIISNNIELGREVIAGIGTVITGNIPSGSSVIGNPARILDKKIELL